MKIIVMQFLSYIKATIEGRTKEFYRKEARRRSAEKLYSQNMLYLGIYPENTAVEIVSEYNACEIKEVLGMLTEKQRTVIELAVMQGCPENEIAVSMQISQQSVHRIKERALKTIRREWEIFI